MAGKCLMLGTLLSITLLLAACGGEEYSEPLARPGNPPSPLFEPHIPSTGAGNNQTDSPEVVKLPIKPGYYTTSVFIDDGNTYRGVATIVDPNGNFATIISNTSAFFGVLAGAGGSDLVGAGTYILRTDNWHRIDSSIEGQASDQENAAFSMSAPDDGYQSSHELARTNAISDITISLADISGTYMSNTPGSITTSITVDLDGSVSGSDERGCVFNGTLSIPDNSVNTFQVIFSASNCNSTDEASAEQANGEYAALGVFLRDGLGDAIDMIGTNGETVLGFTGIK